MTSPLADVQLKLCENIDDIAEMKRWVGERRTTPLAFDTESEGLSPHKHKLRLVQFGDLHRGYVIPWERWSGAALEILNTYEGEFVAHNSVFDARFLDVHGGWKVPWTRLHDTLTLARIDDPSRSNGLKPLSQSLVDRRATAGEKALHSGMTDNHWDWGSVPIDYPPYWIYSGLDGVLTSHLYQYLRPRVEATASGPYDLERAANRICSNMMLHGLMVDVPYVEAAIAKYEKVSADVRGWLKSRHSVTSPASSGQLRRAFEKLGQEILFWTDKGQPQFTKATLGFYKTSGQNAAVQQLAEYLLHVRKADKMPRDYLHKFLDMRDSDGMLRMSINVMGAITSRMSVSEPPLQQLSRD